MVRTAQSQPSTELLIIIVTSKTSMGRGGGGGGSILPTMCTNTVNAVIYCILVITKVIAIKDSILMLLIKGCGYAFISTFKLLFTIPALDLNGYIIYFPRASTLYYTV